jgi:caffeoyl-CoA O-methyltransferase
MADSTSRAGQTYANSEILGYVEQVHHPHDEGLQLAQDAPDKHGMPSIQVAPAEGRLMEMLLRMVGAKRVVEIGTLAGYSALWMARALPEDGRLWTIENDAKHAAVARETIKAAGYEDRVRVLEGDGLERLSEIVDRGPFCAVFIDADKERYDLYGQWAAANIRAGGLLIGDNAYLFGDLLADSSTAAAMRRFHEQMARDFVSVCVPTPDGLAIGLKR